MARQPARQPATACSLHACMSPHQSLRRLAAPHDRETRQRTSPRPRRCQENGSPSHVMSMLDDGRGRCCVAATATNDLRAAHIPMEVCTCTIVVRQSIVTRHVCMHMPSLLSSGRSLGPGHVSITTAPGDKLVLMIRRHSPLNESNVACSDLKYLTTPSGSSYPATWVPSLFREHERRVAGERGIGVVAAMSRRRDAHSCREYRRIPDLRARSHAVVGRRMQVKVRRPTGPDWRW